MNNFFFLKISSIYLLIYLCEIPIECKFLIVITTFFITVKAFNVLNFFKKRNSTENLNEKILYVEKFKHEKRHKVKYDEKLYQ